MLIFIHSYVAIVEMVKEEAGIMRLQNIYHICKENYDNIKFESTAIKQNNVTYYKVANWNILKESLLDLKKIDMFVDSVERIFQVTDLLHLPENKIVLDSNQNGALGTKIKELSMKVSAVIELCESMGYNDNRSCGFDVKLPEESDLGILAENVDNLNKALSQCPFFQNIDMKIKVEVKVLVA